MIVIVQLKKHVTDARVLCIIISKLGYWQEPSPVILLEVDKDSEVRLHGAILPFGLPIYLRMEGGRELLLDVEEVAKR